MAGNPHQEPRWTFQQFYPLENTDKTFKQIFVSSRIEIDFENDTIFLNGKSHQFTRNYSSFRVCKFMQFRYLFDSCSSPQYVAFGSPLKWNDPYDNMFSKVFEDRKNNFNCEAYCFCSTYATTFNAEAMWKIHDPCTGQKKNLCDTMVRIDMSFCRLIEELAKYTATHDDFEFYISLIDYSLDQNTLKSLRTKLKKDVQNGKKLKATEYAQYLSFKRKAFAYENELRIIAIRKKDTTSVPKVLLPINIDFQRTMCEVTIEPNPPQKSPNNTSQTKCDKKFADKNDIDIKTELASLHVSCPIKKSRLYEL